jgi:peptidoglycan/LPS O-acetylase OafA/YrhL
LLTNSLLVNYLIYPQAVLLGVTWTLVVEVIFYLLLIVLLPVFRRSVWLGIAIELTIVHLVLMSRSELGPSWSLFAVNVSFIPILLCGQIVWAAAHRKIPRWLAGGYLALSWALYVWADRPDMARQDNSSDLALAFAFLLFLIGLLAEPRLRQRAMWTRLSERSYSLYLLHAVIAFPMLDALHPALPIELAVVVAVLATFAGVEVSYRLVEGPSHRLARWLSHRDRPGRLPPYRRCRSSRTGSSSRRGTAGGSPRRSRTPAAG